MTAFATISRRFAASIRSGARESSMLSRTLSTASRPRVSSSHSTCTRWTLRSRTTLSGAQLSDARPVASALHSRDHDPLDRVHQCDPTGSRSCDVSNRCPSPGKGQTATDDGKEQTAIDGCGAAGGPSPCASARNPTYCGFQHRLDDPGTEAPLVTAWTVLARHEGRTWPNQLEVRRHVFVFVALGTVCGPSVHLI